MTLHYSYRKHILEFRKPAMTSRGPMKTHTTYVVQVTDSSAIGKIGYGEAAPLPGLSIDATDDFEIRLTEILQMLNDGLPIGVIDLEKLPSLCFALETALRDLNNGGKRKIIENGFFEGVPIPINGLVWMADSEIMLKEALEKIDAGFNCIKFKVGAIDFDEECRMLERLRKQYSAFRIEIRLDANGALEPDEALPKLKEWSRFEVHSVEQPIKSGQEYFLESICRQSRIPVALDEELIGVSVEHGAFDLLKKIKPHYLILKPTLVGGIAKTEQWIKEANKINVGWWLTSALESNIGLNAIAQLASYFRVTIPQGLGTGELYTNNFQSPLKVKNGQLFYDETQPWVL